MNIIGLNVCETSKDANNHEVMERFGEYTQSFQIWVNLAALKPWYSKIQPNKSHTNLTVCRDNPQEEYVRISRKLEAVFLSKILKRANIQ